MTTLDKSRAAMAVMVLATMIVWFSYMVWAIQRQASIIEAGIAMIAIIGGGNALFYAYIRTLRCPNCGIRFGRRMFSTGLVQHPWPRTVCWNCSANMSIVEERQGPFRSDEPISPIPAKSEFPLRWQAIFVLAAIWNALILADPSVLNAILTRDPTAAPSAFNSPGLGLALLFMFAFSSAAKSLKDVQAFVLKEGHSIAEIKSLLLLLQVISGVTLLAFAITLFASTIG